MWPWPLTTHMALTMIAVSQNARADWHWTKGDGSRSFMTMTLTIWWPRSGVRIYQIVTGVTLGVGVPSTHLVVVVVEISLNCVHDSSVDFAEGNSKCIFSCDQAALQMVFSVCLSVRLSVCPSVRLSVCPSHLFDYVPIIGSSWNFQELLPMTNVRSMQKVKVRGQRSRSQRSQPNLTVSGL